MFLKAFLFHKKGTNILEGEASESDDDEIPTKQGNQKVRMKIFSN